MKEPTHPSTSRPEMDRAGAPGPLAARDEREKEREREREKERERERDGEK